MHKSPAELRAYRIEMERKRDRERYRRAHPEPVGRNAIRTADPILRAIFTAAFQKKITRKQIAKAMNRSEVTISYWKQGRSSPSSAELPGLAAAVGCEIVVRSIDDK